MSLSIGALAFEQSRRKAVTQLGTLAGSGLSGLLGVAALTLGARSSGPIAGDRSRRGRG